MQNLELTHEARAARALRDELDIQRERANKVHLLETELQSYKDKMSQMESLKCRIEEVREENKILVETKEMLEDQLESSRKRCAQIMRYVLCMLTQVVSRETRFEISIRAI